MNRLFYISFSCFPKCLCWCEHVGRQVVLVILVDGCSTACRQQDEHIVSVTLVGPLFLLRLQKEKQGEAHGVVAEAVRAVVLRYGQGTINLSNKRVRELHRVTCTRAVMHHMFPVVLPQAASLTLSVQSSIHNKCSSVINH